MADQVPGAVLLTGRVLTISGLVAEGAVVLDGSSVAYAGPLSDLPPCWAATPEAAGWRPGLTLLPGLVDIHCHGGAGGEFGASVESARTAAAHHHVHGTTSVVGSLVSAPAADLVAAVTTLARLVAGGELAGIHLEGPFLSTVRCGAQNPASLVDADLALVDALAEAGPGAVVQMTWAPERRGGDTVPAALARVGALAALGHTDTDYAGAAEALRSAAGAAPRGALPLVTHLFNGMPPLLSRAPGPAAAALAAAARGEAVVEVIADGVHVDAGTVRMVYDTVGPEHTVLVSDAMAASGMPDGQYSLGGLDVLEADGAARLAVGGNLAGGVSVLLDQVRWLVRDLGIPLSDAVAMASSTPARALALDGVGSLTAGGRSDVLVVDEDLCLQRAYRSGVVLG